MANATPSYLRLAFGNSRSSRDNLAINVFAQIYSEAQITYHRDRTVAFLVDSEDLDGYGACPQLQAPRVAGAIFNLLVGTPTPEKAAA